MSTLTIAELQAQVDTDLSDAVLQQIIDAAEQDIENYVGPESAYTVELDPTLLTVLEMPVKTSAIVSVTEFTDAASEPTQTALSSDDYELSENGWTLRRLSDGTNARSIWGWHVVIVLTPEPRVAQRKQAAVQLARMEITHTGYVKETTGDWSATTRELGKERARILRRLSQRVLA